MKPLVFALLLIAGPAFAQEDPLIAVLRSDAPLKEKADACQALARVGTRQAVPALAALLDDEQLSHRARFALETIADPSADVALREALGQVHGRLLIGVIHSLGVRRDPRSVESLAPWLAGTDPAVAQAAARALGALGPAAAPALLGALSTDSTATRLAVCEGLFRCAEAMPAAEAAPIYDRIRALPDLPQHLRTAALGGAIRSRGPQGVALALEAIQGGPVPAAEVISLSMALPGAEATQALAAILPKVDGEKQILLVRALGNRGDAAAAPALVALAQGGPADRRTAAVQSLAQLREPASLPALVTLVGDPEPGVAGAAWAGLAGWPGPKADAAVVGLLSASGPKTRVAAMAVVAQRRLAAANPALLKAAGEADPAVAGAAFEALGEIGGPAEIPGVVEALLETRAVTESETALVAICERQRDLGPCAGMVLPGLAKAKGEARHALLRTLGTLGGPQTLAAMRAAAGDPDETVRETAWRALCDWPTADALPDLATMTRGSAPPGLRSLALRAQLRLIPLQSATAAQQAAHVRDLLPIVGQMKEERLALSTLGNVHGPESLALVLPYLDAPALREEASAAAVAIAEKIVASHPAEVAAAMPRVHTANAPLAERARQVLARVPPGTTEAGFTPIFNGTDLAGWDGKPGWWKVQDGALTAESTPDKPCQEPNYLVWRGGEPADFELIADFRLSKAGNSGIQLRSRALPNWDTSGYQADMTGDGALVGFVYEHSRGLIAGRGERVGMDVDGKRNVAALGDAAALAQAYRIEDWNTYRILCRGPEITLWINGTLMCQFTDRDPKHAASRGVIALQMHPGPPMKIEFSNIRLKKL